MSAPAEMTARDRAWQLGYRAGRKDRRQLGLAAVVLALVYVFRDPHRHVMLRALAFYSLLVALPICFVAALGWLAWRLARLMPWKRSARRIRSVWFNYRHRGELDTLPF